MSGFMPVLRIRLLREQGNLSENYSPFLQSRNFRAHQIIFGTIFSCVQLLLGTEEVENKSWSGF
ncbi:MAG: hypothetical protein A3K03_01090 [Bdellovibrionales bacterium RIFOXYD1_FULL_44_7]|nr:MAG: hypothetical protein A3K03_01090 [Bdellovibrionales bacterium RIFOXYD1_FULL_44_7]